MINRIEIGSSYSNAPAIPLSSSFVPNTDPVQIRSIDGLGPVKAEVEKTPFATGRGELWQGSSTGTRNIVMTLGLNPSWIDQTMASLRKLLYRYLMVESWATLRFFTDEYPVVYISGVVESFEPNIFSEDPEIQVSILCPKPDFIDVDTTLIRGTVDNLIEQAINYEGTAPTGFIVRVESSPTVPSYVGDVKIQNNAPGVIKLVQVKSATIDASHRLEVSTVRSTRYVYSVDLPSGIAINILAKLYSFSEWPELLPGENILSVGAVGPGAISGQEWTLAYFNRFGGL